MDKKQILFAGDPHGCFRNIIKAAEQYRPEAMILLGDYNLEQPLQNYLEPIIDTTKIYWIAGNHDFDSQLEYDCLFNSTLFDKNLHLKVVEIAGLKIAGLGGIFAGRVWLPGNSPKWQNRKHWLKYTPANIKKIPLKIDNAIWFHDFEKMKKTIRADILVSHEAPSSYRHGFNAIDELAEAIGAKKVFHGHHHVFYNEVLNNGIKVTGTSICGVVNLAGEQLISKIKK